MTKSSAPKVASSKATRSAKPKLTSKRTRKAGGGRHKSAPTVVAEKVRRAYRAISPKVSVEGHRDAGSTHALFEQFPSAQLPETFHVVAQRNVANMRQVYEGSKNTLQVISESWQKSFGAAGQVAAALNRRFIERAERNINTGFDLATDLAGAKNPAEVMGLQAAYWRTLFGELLARGGERRAQSTGRGPRRN